MVCLMQSIRFNVHAGFALKVAAMSEGGSRLEGGGGDTSIAAAEALALLDRAAGAFTAGQRCFYAFLPLFLSLFGSTVMFLSTVLLVVGLYCLDVLPIPGVKGKGGGVVESVEAGVKEARAAV